MMAEPTEVRFGWVAIQKGYVTPQQVVDALVIQAKENFTTGKHTLIGEILLELGLLKRSQIDEILQSLKQIRQERAD